MARRFTRGRGRLGSVRRETLWLFASPFEQLLNAPSTAVLSGTLNAAGLALRPFTIVRVRGHLGIRSDQAASSEDYSGSLGYSIVSDQAAAIGVTAVPTPETDRGSDLFFVYETLAGHYEVLSAASSAETGHWKDFDSKAMRRVNEGQDLAITMETSSISSGAIMFESARILVKLH